MNDTRLALCDVSGLLKDMLDKMSGKDGEMWAQAFGRTLRKENFWPTFPTWKTLTLGHPASPKAYRAALEANGYKVGSYANQLLDRVNVSPTETELELILLTVAELGLKNGARYDAICARAKELGLDLCPAEVGPKLRLEYRNQPREWLRIAMEPLTDSGGYLGVFHVGRDRGDLWLHGHFGNPDYFWDGDSQFVFVRRK